MIEANLPTNWKQKIIARKIIPTKETRCEASWNLLDFIDEEVQDDKKATSATNAAF